MTVSGCVLEIFRDNLLKIMCSCGGLPRRAPAELSGALSASGLLGDPSRKCPFLTMPEVKAPCFLTSVARLSPGGEDVVGPCVISRG